MFNNKYMVFYSYPIVLIFITMILALFRNIQLRKKIETELEQKKYEMAVIYQEIVATGNELKINLDKLSQNQQQLKKSEERYRIVAESTMDIIWEGDLINKKRFFSDKLYSILGYNNYELEDFDNWFKIVHPDDIDYVKKNIDQQISDQVEIKAFEYRVRCKSGNYKWIYSNTKCEFDADGNAIAVFGAITDITKLKEQKLKINNLAYYDTITKLPNRAFLRESIHEEIKKCSNLNQSFSLIFIDLDNFKFVNDSFGHLTGDKLLIEIAKRLKATLSDNMTAFRLGGDEFIVLIRLNPSKYQVECYIKTLMAAISNPVTINSNIFYVTHSSGIVFYPENGNNFDELLKNADAAMYKSKDCGKSTYTFYDPQMSDIAKAKILMQANIENALFNNEFVLHYQPITSSVDNSLMGFEALIRWQQPKSGLIMPEEFISIAEENGLIIKIGQWVIKTACDFAKKIYDSGLNDFFVSVNVSGIQLNQYDFANSMLNTIKHAGIPHHLLLVEITESVLMESMVPVLKNLNILRKNDIKIALDDFGCGYSSLKYMKSLPINTIKIDKSFIDDIKSKNDKHCIASTMIMLAKQLRLNVICEGVENTEQFEYLKKHHCDMIQGFYISKPVSEEAIYNSISNQLKETV